MLALPLHAHPKTEDSQLPDVPTFEVYVKGSKETLNKVATVKAMISQAR